MGKQIFNIKGMLRDLSPSKTSNDFAYEIRNLRLTAQEDSTMLSLVSEKSNRKYTITGDPITGKIIGYCTLNNYLVLFTYDIDRLANSIYRLEIDSSAVNPTFISERLYIGDLGMDASVKIEALGVYENANIQKVYWIDGIHQPRFINISPNADHSHWYTSQSPFDFVPVIGMDETVSIEKVPYSGMFNAGTIQYMFTYYNKNGQQSAVFYQSPIHYIAYDNKGASPEETVDNSFKITIKNIDTTFDYVRIYSIFRSSENGTSMCKKVIDLKTSSAASIGSPCKIFTSVSLGTETSVPYESSINLNLKDVKVLDSSYKVVDIENFLTLREGENTCYSIDSNYVMFIIDKNNHSIVALKAADGEMLSVWKQVLLMGVNRGGLSLIRKWASVTATENDSTEYISTLEYIDNNLSGEVVSYSEILYAGGTNIIPSTMAQKNQTLFFGNYKTISISEENKATIASHSAIHFGYSETPVEKGVTGSFYMYKNQLDLDASQITTFKGGETYYFGIILQNEYGSWSDVIPIGKKMNEYYPKDMVTDNRSYFFPVKAYITFDTTALDIINNYKAIKVVRLDTLPSVVCQGVVCPTVFSKKRKSNAPYCQSSWFFRDLGSAKEGTTHKIQNIHNQNIREFLYANLSPLCAGEIQGADNTAIAYYDATTESLSDMDMFIDWNTLTLNSPDIEFGPKLNMNYKMRIVGILPITSGRTSMMYSWSTNPKTSLTNNNVYTPIIHNNLDVMSYEIDLNTLAYEDSYTGVADLPGTYLYPVYPWHRNGSLSGQSTPSGNNDWYALLDTKVMASLRESAYTKYHTPQKYNITKMSVYQDDEVPLLLEADIDNYLFNGAKVYMGSIDTILVASESGYNTYGLLENGDTISVITSGNKDAVRMRYKSTKHGVFSLKSYKGDNTNLMYVMPNVAVAGTTPTGSGGNLANISPKAIIKGVLSPSSTESTPNGTIFHGIQDANQFLVGDVVMEGIWLYYVKQVVDTTTLLIDKLDKNWFDLHPGGDKVGFTSSTGDTPGSQTEDDWYQETYKAYFTYDHTDGKKYYSVDVEYFKGWSDEGHPYLEYIETFTVSNAVYRGIIESNQLQTIEQLDYDVSTINPNDYSYMYIVELYTNDLEYNYENHTWYVASEPKKTGKYGVEASIGDTYYQRYDCLKTYPYALEDQNQIVEIFSFMCETKINIDGRYDSRRGMADNTSVTGTNFNLLNKAYTQDDNFFTYHYLDPDDFNIDEFPNQLIWTMTKVYGSDIDAWTQIVPTSTLDMDGSLGEVRALRLWNDNLLCFQDMGIAKIMYNERTTMSTEQGIPVEIANSGKVDGSQYLSNSIGCKNKESIKITQEGIYFIDSNTREIYRFSKGLESLSKGKGFNTYMQGEVDLDTEKTFYDPKLKDVYFRFNRKIGNSTITECLVFNEQLGEFTSFFDYDMDFLFPFKDSLVAVEHNSHNLWKQFDGDSYLRYFGQTTGGGAAVYKNYSVQLVSADNPLIDKIFTGLEFRADVISGSIADSHVQVHPNNTYASANALPFQTIQVWNEYQDTGSISFQSMMRASTNLSQKFRIWRGEIGRDSTYKLDRIRSPWARIKLTGGGSNLKTVIHDVTVAYM